MKKLLLFILFLGIGIQSGYSQDCIIGGLYIDAYLLDPNGANNFDTDGDTNVLDGDEFVQICNSSPSSVDLSSYILYDDASNPNEITLAGNLGPGECLVVITNYVGSLPSGFLSYGSTSAIWNNGGDIINLTDGNSTCSINTDDFPENDGCVTVMGNTPVSDCSITPTDLGSPLSVFPVKLSSFTAKKDRNQAVLNWTTASEVDNDFFMIEKSKDGKHFEVIGKVEGNGTTTRTHDYEYVDYNISLNNYYRLNQFDYDGKNEYSNIVSLRTNLKDKIDLINTRVEQVMIIDSGLNESVHGSVVSSTGSIVKEFSVEAGKNNIDMSDINSGIYYITIVSTDQNVTEKIIKL